MIAALTASPGLFALAALGALAGMAGALRHARGRRRIALMLLQLPLAALLLMALAAPAPGLRGTLHVLSGAGGALPPDAAHAVALPGAQAPASVARVPDLATALRRHPAVERVHVIGDGLAPHDRAALGARALAYTPGPQPDRPAFVAVEPPGRTAPGADWTVRGRVAGAKDTDRVELLDPDGRVAARATPDAQGRFALQGRARAEGRLLQRLQLRRGEQRLASTRVPVVVERPGALRVLLLAAVPSPETKFLRRWALDAGLALDAQVDLAPGLRQQRGAPAFDAAALARYDLVIADERSWPLLAARRDALEASIADGLGLLLRVTGPLPAGVARDWSALGVTLALDDATPAAVALAGGHGDVHAWPVRADGVLAVAARDAQQRPLAVWTPKGRGRVGAAWIADSFRLHQRGHAPRHAAWWSALVGTLARPREPAAPVLLEPPLPGRRAVACGVPTGARLEGPGASSVPLLAEAGCAAFWPRLAGWHRIVAPATEPAGRALQFHVPAAADSRLRAADADRRATRERAHAARGVSAARASGGAAGRSAWWIGALLLAASLWWLERRGFASAASPAAGD